MPYVELEENNRGAKLNLDESLTTKSRQAWHVPIILSSSAVCALLLFATIDLCLRFCFHPDVYQLPNRTFIWWSVADYRKLKQIPETLIFGSSLMLAVIERGDATYLNRPIDSAMHHQSLYLKDKLHAKIGGRHDNFSLAVGGQMASDVYAISQTLINPASHPSLIIWGIAPRDFIDAAFREPIASDTARYMNKIGGVKIIKPQHTSLPFYIEESLLQISKLFANKENIVAIQNATFRDLFKNISAVFHVKQIRSISIEAPTAAPETFEIGERMTLPCETAPIALTDDTREYMTRYHPFKPQSFHQQLSFCENFLEQTDKLGIKVLFVNMPITSSNMSLLPAGVYTSYLDNVKKMAANHTAKFYDLNGDQQFSEKDFFDPVHLNGIGAKKFVNLLSTLIKSDHLLQ